MHCAACRDLYPNDDLDQQLWCPRCGDARARAVRRGKHLGGMAVALPFGVWVALEASYEVLSPWAWLLPLAAAYYLGYRIGKEVASGWVRWRRSES